jgi:hypothetical protein
MLGCRVSAQETVVFLALASVPASISWLSNASFVRNTVCAQPCFLKPRLDAKDELHFLAVLDREGWHSRQSGQYRCLGNCDFFYVCSYFCMFLLGEHAVVLSYKRVPQTFAVIRIS